MIKKRKPFLALLLSFVPGLGQLYNGQVKKAVILVLIDILILAFAYYTQIFMSVAGVLTLLTLFVSVALYRLIDAFVVAKKNPHYELKRYNTWYVYLLFFFGILIFHALIDLTKTDSVQSFTIPTSSMDPTICMEDRVVAQGGFYKNHNVVRNDLIVFHYPAEYEKPIDEKTHYIKRCVALPGDTLSIRDKQVYINGSPSIISSELKYKFKCFTNHTLSESIKKKYNIHSYDIYVNDLLTVNDNTLYLIDLSKENVEKLRSAKIFDSIVDFKLAELDQHSMLFPFARVSQHWTPDDYGSLWVPKAGTTLKLDSNLVEIYSSTIEKYEGHTSVEAVGDKLNINGKLVSEYTFKQNYYFMMGDNRQNSADSRYWGFVPADHLFGKAWLIFDSEDPDSDEFRKERFLKLIQ